MESFVKETEIPVFGVLQLENAQIVCKLPLKKVTDDSKVSAERKLATMIGLFLIQEGEISSFYVSKDVLLRHLEKTN